MTDLRLGDALGPDGLAALADQSVDVAITDPPFDARTHRAAVERGNWRKGRREVAGALPFAAFGPEQIEATAAHLGRLVRRWALVFCGERQVEQWARALEDAGLRFIRLGAAVRLNPRPQLSGDRPAPGVDPIVIAHTKGPMRWRGGGHAGVWESPSARFDTGRVQLHPTQKPLHLIRSLVEDFTDPGDLILDPFVGSGTTAVAAAQLGRRFVGWERDAGYYAAAVARLEREGVRVGSAPFDARKALTRASEALTCRHCREPLPASSRRHARYHPSCRVLACRARRLSA